MIDINQELGKYGLDAETYKKCLDDIRGKIDGRNDMDWAEIVDKYNLGIHSDTLRKASQTIFGGAFVSQFFKALDAEENSDNDYATLLRQEKEALIKERQKLSDERVDYQKSLREEARRESFLSLIERIMAKQIEPLNYVESPQIDSDEDMVVCLSDLHVGLDVKNWWNTYNTSILRERLSSYIDQIRAIQKVHCCKRCDLVLGGDNISGLIHPNLRLQNNENVVEQIKIATVYIADFISELQKIFEQINVHSVSGNHSRLSPNKEEHLKGEELDALIPFCLDIKFSNCPNVQICTDGYLDDTINTFSTRGGKLFYIVHGDKDTPANVTQRLTLMTGTKPDAIIMHHRHHNAYDSAYGVKIVQVGCTCGTDDHCVDLRISGEPEQCVIITTPSRAVKCFYDIKL